MLRILKSAISYARPCKITFDPVKLQFRIEFNLVHTCTELDEYLHGCFEGAADGWMEGDITIPFEFCKTLTDSPGLTNAAMLVDVKNNRIIINDAAPSNTVLTNRGFELKRTTTWTAMMDARPDEEGSILCKNVSLMLDVNLTTTCIVLQAFFGLVSDRMMQGKNVIIRNFANLHGEKKKRKDGTIVYKPKCEISDTFGKGEDPKSKNHRSDLAKCCSPGSALWRQDHDS